MKNILLSLSILASALLAKDYTFNLNGNHQKENTTLTVKFETDEDGKIKANQRFDIKNNTNLKSIKILTASGLKGTLKDEREVIVFYKTSLEVSGLKIRNLYKVGHTRLYSDESNISITFDKDHYQNIVSYLRYHNIKSDVIKDIDNMYGTWEEIE
ncbi:MAG: hypothetical protein DRG78_20445 [Epsilonproteobacteria bacterium]|nr:MAG: hypothetical protein DRG78_20445 [Campylobacterota bacterium]